MKTPVIIIAEDKASLLAKKIQKTEVVVEQLW
jgi:hypothetical protein